MALEGFQLELVFSTPIVIGRLPGADELNPALEAAILERRRVDAGITRSNVGSWHSDTRLFEWGGEAARRLAAEIIELADANTLDLMAERNGRRGWTVEGWANVTDSGGFNQQHTHPGCFWSAVYYVRIDEGEGGHLVLHDPRMPVLNMHAPDLRFRHAGIEQMVHTSPSTGMLILFPSWLTHSVVPWQGSGLRISIAVNLSAPATTSPLAAN